MLHWITASNSTLTGISKCDQMAVWLFRCIFFQCVNVAALRARSFLFLKDKKAPKLRIKIWEFQLEKVLHIFIVRVFICHAKTKQDVKTRRANGEQGIADSSVTIHLMIIFNDPFVCQLFSKWTDELFHRKIFKMNPKAATNDCSHYWLICRLPSQLIN